MENNKVDFHQLGNKLWNIANIFRDDTLKTTEYLEEFSYFLFLKLFDDQEIKNEKLAKLDGKKYTPYLPEELRFYNWANKIVNNEIDVTQAVSTVKEIFQKLAKIKDHDGRDLWLFRKLFDKHIWRIKYGPTIRDLLSRLIDLKLEENFDVMGRAYEFVVQKLGEQKQYGQYFTPRHIIHFMVELADPQIGETIYDPAAGTGGFILRAFEVVKSKIEKSTQKSYNSVKEPTATYCGYTSDRAEKLLSNLKEIHLWAVEKAPDVFKLAMMNMILHNDGKSNLKEADSLDNRAQQENKEKFDVILSNPPYGPLTQSRVGVFTYHVKRFEALFIQHIMNSLSFSKEGKQKPSRAVVIILDKILFDNSSSFKNIRKKLLREYNLKAIFSMPAGIFQPYSGVKTTVLYFERPTKKEWKKLKDENSFSTKKVMFFDIQSDGFTLATQRRPINGAFQGENPNIYDPPCGDLPKAVEVFKKWNKYLENSDKKLPDFVDNKHVWIADIEEIKNKDFNLNPGLYRKVERGKIKWDWVRLGDILANYSIRNKEKEKLPVYSITKERGIVLADDFFKENVYGKNKDTYEKNLSNYKIIEKGCFVYNPYRVNIGSIGYVNREIRGLVSPAYVVFKVKNSNYVNEKFLFYVFKSEWFLEKIRESTSGSIRDSLSYNLLSEIVITLPPLEIQKQIVERLDKQQAIIEKAKEMEKAILDAGIDDSIFEGEWDWVEMWEVLIENPQYGANTPAIEGKKEEDIRYIRITDVDDFGNLKDDTWMTAKKVEEKYILEDGDLLFARSGATAGKTFLYEESKIKEKALYAGYFIRFKFNEKISPKFVFYFTKSKCYLYWISSIKREAGQPNINAKEYLSLKIPLPPLEKQQEIIDFLDTQFKTIEHIRKLKENAEKTIKLILEKEVFAK